jgi:hypothetical protein
MIGSKINRLAAGLGMIIWAAGLCHAQETDTEYSRERYEVIIDRSPFGADPLAGSVVTDQAAAATLKTLEKELRLCFLLKSQTGDVRAGFQNILLEVDIENSTATLQYQGKPLTFELTKGTAATKAAAKKPSPPTQPQRRFGGGFRRNTPPAEQAQPTPPPQPKVPQESPEEQARRQAEVRENLQQYQMEVIRSGMPPLPIALTEEMDNQLVAEGVLPPVE